MSANAAAQAVRFASSRSRSRDRRGLTGLSNHAVRPAAGDEARSAAAVIRGAMIHGEPDVLVIGSQAVADAVAAAFPHRRVDYAPRPLAGLWAVAEERYGVVIVEGDSTGWQLRLIESIRGLRADVHLVAVSPATSEPSARIAVERGADDYLLLPLLVEELERVLRRPSRTRPQNHPPMRPVHSGEPHRMAGGGPSDDLVQLAQVLQSLDDGVQPMLRRFASLLMESFGAAGVKIRADALVESVGDVEEIVLVEPLRHCSSLIGEVGLGRSAMGTYAAGAAQRLTAMARILELAYALVRQQCELRDLAWSDDLTGLRNRRYFDQRLSELVEHARTERGRVTVVLFDVDGFKQYNDVLGHQVGDRLIQEIAQLLTRTCRETDVVARRGGDEFAVILWDAEKPRVPGSQHPSAPEVLADRFARVIEAHEFQCLGPSAPAPVTISGGLASYPWDGRTPEELLIAADEALLRAKRNGKNCIQLSDGGTASPES